MGIRRGSISTPIIADGLMFNIDAANRASYIPDTTTTYNTMDFSQSGSLFEGVGFVGPPTASWLMDGTDDYMSASAVLSTGTTMSWSLWMKTTDTSGYSGIISSNVDPAYDSWVFRRNTDDTYEWIVDWTSHSEFPASAVEDNKWHHVVGTYDGTTIKLYLDGVLYDSDSESSHDIAGSKIYIGNYMERGSLLFFYGGYICNG